MNDDEIKRVREGCEKLANTLAEFPSTGAIDAGIRNLRKTC